MPIKRARQGEQNTQSSQGNGAATRKMALPRLQNKQQKKPARAGDF